MNVRTLTRVREALERLADDDRTLLSLLYLERLTPAEAAGALQCPRAHVESRSRELLEQFRRTPAARPGRRVA